MKYILLFNEVVNDFEIEQLVIQTNGNNHDLDLVFMMHPDIINNVNVVPGNSDYEAITIEIKLSKLNSPHSI